MKDKVVKKYKPNWVRAPQNKLTPEILQNLGFKKVILKHSKTFKETVYRISVPYYAHIIEVRLGNYPASNPNCGMVGIHTPEQDVPAPTDKDINRKIKIGPETVMIAWYVNTPERLRNIIVSLTQQNV